MARSLHVQETTEGFSNDNTFGWGTLFSGKFKTFGNDKLGFGLTYGEGMGRWRTALNGMNADAVLTEDGLEAVPSYGGYINYTRIWSPKWNSSFMYSYLGADNPTGSPDTALKSSNYGLANLIWDVTPLINFGLEYTYVDRNNEDDSFGSNNRMALIFVYKFHKDTPKTSPYGNVSYLFGGG